METITAGGVRLECQWWGAPGGAGPTLVLLHEGLGCVAMWRDFPARLHRRTGLPVFAWSRAGYGGSDPVELPRRADYMHVEGREVTGAVLDAAGIGDAVLVGHSDGASIAIVHAGEYGAGLARRIRALDADARRHPRGTGHGAGPAQRIRAAGGSARRHPRGADHGAGPARRIRALVLLAPHVFCEGVSLASIRAAGDAYRAGGLRERLARYHGARVDDAFFGWHDAWLLPEFRRWSIEAFLPHIAAPMLLVQGERDAYGSVAQLDAIERGAAGPVTRRWLADCGHAPHRERPEETLDAIAAFFAEVVPSG